MIPTIQPGSIFDGGFRIERKLGAGGAGSVFLAEQLDLHRLVAIKLLHQFPGYQADTRRFLQEARALARLAHPGIVKVFHCHLTQDGLFYIVMEYVEGCSLKDLLAEKCILPWETAVKIALQVCQSIACAHKEGIIHRDLKPENIILQGSEDYHVKVVDFGLASLAASDGQNDTVEGTLLGSVAYMSPELCRGIKADGRTDIYSLACVLYECLTGKPPFGSENSDSIIRKHLRENPAPLKSVHGLPCPAGLQGVISRALAKDRNLRYGDMETFATDLRLILEQPDQPLQLELQTKHARVVYCVLGALALILVFSFAIYSLHHTNSVKNDASIPPRKPVHLRNASDNLVMSRMQWLRLCPLVLDLKDDNEAADLLVNWLLLHKGKVSCSDEYDAILMANGRLCKAGRKLEATRLLSDAVYSPSKDMRSCQWRWTALAESLSQQNYEDHEALKKDLEFLKARADSKLLGELDRVTCLLAIAECCQRLNRSDEVLKWLHEAEQSCKRSAAGEVVKHLPEVCAKEALVESSLAHYDRAEDALRTCKAEFKRICSLAELDNGFKVIAIARLIDVLSNSTGWQSANNPLAPHFTELAVSCLDNMLTGKSPLPPDQKAWLLYNRANFALLDCLVRNKHTSGFSPVCKKVIESCINDLKCAALSYDQLTRSYSNESLAFLQPSVYDECGCYKHGSDQAGDNFVFQQRNCLVWLSALQHIAGDKTGFEEHIAAALDKSISPPGPTHEQNRSETQRAESVLATAVALNNFALAFKKHGFCRLALPVFLDSKMLCEGIPNQSTELSARLQTSIQACRQDASR